MDSNHSSEGHSEDDDDESPGSGGPFSGSGIFGDDSGPFGDGGYSRERVASASGGDGASAPTGDAHAPVAGSAAAHSSSTSGAAGAHQAQGQAPQSLSQEPWFRARTEPPSGRE